MATEGTEKTKSTEVKKKLNVLIVDDDPLNRRLHEMIIKTIGGISQTAKNGEEAVILHRGGASFDLILMDKEMPERDGVSVHLMILICLPNKQFNWIDHHYTK